MATQRIDLYSTFHKGLRKLLFDLLVDAGRTDFRDDEANRKICDELNEAIALMREHGRLEDEVFHPAIEARCPGATRELDEQHRFEEELIAGLDAQQARLRDSAPAARVDLGVHLYRTLGMFCASYLDHLAAEEEELLPKFFEHFSDDELAHLRREAQSRLEPEQIARWLVLALPALRHEERETLLAGARATSPDGFSKAAERAKDMLPQSDWSLLAQSLGVE